VRNVENQRRNMKTTNKSKSQFVAHHEVGKVYKNGSSYYLLASLQNGFVWVNLSTNDALIIIAGISEIDERYSNDILIDAELVIHEGE